MDLKSQKEIAARILKCGKSRVWLDPSRMGDISESITAQDIRRLIKDGVIKAIPKSGISNYRRKKALAQKRKGRRKGKGSRKGRLGTRMNRKRIWMKRIRTLRKMLKELHVKNRIEKKTYRDLYLKMKSGFFRNKSHLMNYLEKNKLLSEEDVEKKKNEKNKL